MSKTIFIKTFCALITALGICGCTADDDFSTSTKDILTFSADTLKLGTVITTQGSSTRGFVIHNRTSKNLRINNVSLERGVQKSGYMVNVSGIYVGDSYNGDIEVRKGDSLQVFLKIVPNEQHSDFPTLIEDKLNFILESGINQQIVLQAYGQDITELRSVVIDKDTILDGTKPYVVYDSLYVSPGAVLTIEEGVTLMFHNGASLVVDGTVDAKGSQEKPIIFRGDRLDDMFTNQPYDRISGQWKGIFLNESSYGNHLTFCDIHSSYVGIDCKPTSLEYEKLRLENSIVHNTKGDGLTLKKCSVFVGNTQITNSLYRCVAQYGGISTFVHCTIGQFYPFSAMRLSALYYTNEYEGTVAPLYSAKFLNSIITGYTSDEVSGYRTTMDENAPFEYYFENCLLNTSETEDAERIINIVWDKQDSANREKNFCEFNIKSLLFDFRLSSESPARGQGSAAVTQQYYPVDSRGTNRLQDNISDIGCYEYVE